MQLDARPILGDPGQTTRGGVSRLEWVAIALVVVAFAASAFFFSRFDYAGPLAKSMDLVHYREIAHAAPGLDRRVPSPFAYRIAGPYIVGMLPIGDVTGFRTVTLFAAAFLLAGLYAWIRADGGSPLPAATMCATLALSKSTFGFLMANFFQVNDVVVLAILCWVAFFVVRRQWWPAGLLLMLSVPFRESLLAAIPAVVVAAWQSRQRAKAVPAMLVASVGMFATWLAIHAFVQASGGVGIVAAMVANSMKYARPDNVYRLLFNTYVPLTLVPLICWRDARLWFQKRLWLAVLCAGVIIASILGADVERLLTPVFLVLLAFVGHELSRTPNANVLMIATLSASAAASFSRTLTVVSVPGWLSIALSVGVTLLLGPTWLRVRSISPRPVS